MLGLRRVVLTMPLFGVLAPALSPGPAGAGEPSGRDVPPHLRSQPSELYMRVGEEIVEAPPTLLLLAKSYPSFHNKGRVSGG